MTSAKVCEVLAPILRSAPDGHLPATKGDHYVDAHCEPAVDVRQGAGSFEASQQHILTCVLGVHDAGIQRPGFNALEAIVVLPHSAVQARPGRIAKNTPDQEGHPSGGAGETLSAPR